MAPRSDGRTSVTIEEPELHAGTPGDGAARAGVPAERPVPLEPLEGEPLVSVLIPNKDYGRFIGEALEGLARQSYASWEAIVCDDGSSDDSVAVVESHAARDPRITLVRHQTSRGQAAAFNSAFAHARGDIMAFLDSDDTFSTGKLEAMVNLLRDGSAGLAVHPLMVVDGGGRHIQRIPALTRPESGWIAPRVIGRGGRWRWVPTSGVAMRREVADLILPMPEDGFRTAADTFFLVLAPLLTSVAYVDEVLGSYRRHGANVFARESLDLARIEHSRQNLESVIRRVNERIGTGKLRIEDNLKHAELVFQEELLGGDAPRGALVSRYWRLMRAFTHDDLYGSVQKAWAWALYGVAVVLPQRRRAKWLSGSLSASRVKELARRALRPGRH
jgi:glycosyltransferase involved in cell wall biosynthesis